MDFKNLIRTVFAKALTEARLQQGLSRYMLAKRIGHLQPFIDKLEKGRSDIRLSTYVRICQALDIPPEEFMKIFVEFLQKEEAVHKEDP